MIQTSCFQENGYRYKPKPLCKINSRKMSIELVEKGSLALTGVRPPARDVIMYVDTMKFEPTSKFKIYIQQEPESITPLGSQIIMNHGRYDLILTFNEDVLKQCPNARLFHLYTPTWIDPSDYTTIDTTKKQFKISCYCGFKQMTVGHHFRLLLYRYQEMFAGDLFVFYRSSAGPQLPVLYRDNPLLGQDCKAKFVLFETFQFSLVIENCRQKYYFTEKLMDCLITKTIPIYYGCTNIGDYFDTTGWILIDTHSIEEVVQKCSTLDEHYYAKYKDTIEENYKRCFQYIDMWKKLDAMLQSIPEYVTPIA